MKTFITIAFTLFQTLTFGQNLLPGRFSTHSPVDSSFYYQSTLTLKCDNTYIFADSAFVEFGKWEIKKNKLLLHGDSMNRPELGIKVAKSIITFKIKDDKLFCKLIRRNAYNKIPGLFMRTYGKMPKMEKYSDFKNNNKDNYFQRISTTDCN